MCRYVYPSELKTFGSIQNRQEAFSSRGWIGQTLFSNYTVASRLPLHPSAGNDPYEDFDSSTLRKGSTWNAAYSFVHGGIHPALSFLTPYPSHIKHIGRSLVRKLTDRSPLPPPHPPAPYPGLPSTVTRQEIELYDVNGPVWFRGWAMDPETPEFCEAARITMDQMGVRRMIMGHTLDLEVSRITIVRHCP